MVKMDKSLDKKRINKQIIKEGNGKRPLFKDGSKATFHFRTIIPKTKTDKTDTILDDSRTFKKPFELLVGKSFKLECWETCIKTMMHGEVARFSCPLEDIMDYPSISRSLRDLYLGKEQTGHSCGLHMMQNGFGYDDLNNLQKNMRPLDFEFELLKTEEENAYEKELWQMDSKEMLDGVPRYHVEGNKLFKEGKVEEAEKIYANAIGCLKHLQIKERPGTESWMDLDKQQIPLLLNYAQCKLLLKEYTVCITMCTEVLEKIDGNDNVKALFKRGKAHAYILDEKECRRDFDKALELDPTIQTAVNRELRTLKTRQKERDENLSRHLLGMFNDTAAS